MLSDIAEWIGHRLDLGGVWLHIVYLQPFDLVKVVGHIGFQSHVLEETDSLEVLLFVEFAFA